MGKEENILKQYKELQRAKEKGERNEKELNRVQEITHIGTWYLDLATNEVTWTKELYKMYGFDPTKPVPPYTEHQKLFTPESWKILSTELSKTRETGIPYELELRTLKADGSHGWLWVRGETIIDKDRKTIGLWGAAQDISKHKLLEQDLIAAKDRLEDFFSLSPSLMVITNPNGDVFKINKSCKTILGYTEKEILKIGLWSLVHPDDIEKTNKALEEQLKGNRILNFTNRYKTKNGAYRTLEWQATEVKDGFTFAYANDTTERDAVIAELAFQNEEKEKRTVELNKAKEKAENSGEKYRVIFDNSIAPILIADDHGNYSSVNKAAAKLFGCTVAELCKMNVSDLITTESPSAEIRYTQYLNNGEEKGEFSFIDKNGTAKSAEYHSVRVNPDFNVSVMMETTERKKAENERLLITQEIEKRAQELALQNEEKEKHAAELTIANAELTFQNEEKELRTEELAIVNKELAFQNNEIEERTVELAVANKELAFQNVEKEKRAEELGIANKELAFQNNEKEKRADELGIANKELALQNDEKEKRAAELAVANKELAFQNDEKEKRAAELVIANKELAFQNDEKEKRAAELGIANKELAFQNDEKEKRADELGIANKELAFQSDEKEKRAKELVIANKELAFQNVEKEKRAEELGIANKELTFQNDEKEKRATELDIANKELAYQNVEKEKRAAELAIANKELAFQNVEKEKRATELDIANKELAYQNVEKEKRAAELAIANKELAYQNVEKEKRAKELDIANKELVYQTEDLESFSYSVSHDLRAPLRAINGYSQMLKEDYDTVLDAEGKRFLSVVSRNAAKMGMLIDDLLTFSRLGRKGLTKSIVDLNRLVEIFISENNQILPSTAVIKFNNLLPVRADARLLQHVINNLLSNAIKYSAKEEKPVIKIKSQRKSGMLIYSISDNGVGFDMQYATKLFGVFQRLHDQDEFPGNGVGLAIVKRIIHKHDGDVWADAKVGQGANFFFSLPDIDHIES